MNDGHQVGGDAQGEQGRADLLRAQVEFVFDGGDLLAQGGEVIEDQDELPVGDVLGLPRADRLLGRLQQVVDGFRCDVAAAGGVQKLANFALLGHQVSRRQADIANEFLGGGPLSSKTPKKLPNIKRLV